MTWTWAAPAFGVGWLVALCVLVAALMAWGFGRADLPLVLLVAAITAIRL